MKRLMQILVLLVFTMSVIAQENNKNMVTVIGHVTGDTKGYNNIYYYKSGSPLDSALINNGKFIIKIPFTTTFTQLFYTQFETKATHRGYRPFPVLIDRPGIINIDIKIDEGFFKSDIRGNQTVVLYNTFLKQQNEVYEIINNEMTKLYGSSAFMRSNQGPVSFSRDSLMKINIDKMVTDFVKGHPGDFVSAYVLGMNKYNMNADQIEKALVLLSPKMQKSKEVKETISYLYGLKNAIEGKDVKNFVLNDAGNKSLSLDQFKGKYVWIDFWASWCGPCKQAFPHMREIYNKFKGEKFELLGISVDETKAPWLKSVEEIQNPWPQLWDNKSVAAQFAVTAYPTSFLIGPDGKIILKEVGFEPGGTMEKKLDEIFSK